MLPEVTLRDVSRDDVDRVAWWLENEEVSSRWFGHYGCGDPIHRGYEPQHMLEAGEWEWKQVFEDPGRVIFSIHSEVEEHIGECQMILDEEGGTELSIMIGRKDLWHRGYGTSTVIVLLEKAFADLGRERVWVNVPEDNTPAMGLFEKLGFAREATRELCKRPDGSALNASILAMAARSYLTRAGSERDQAPLPVVTITGLPGSGSETIGTEVSRSIGSRFVEAEISEQLERRLGCTSGELESLEANYRSFFGRRLNAIAVPMAASRYDGYNLVMPESPLDFEFVDRHITKQQYLDGLKGVVKTVCLEGNVVLHGHGSHLFLPPKLEALSVFVAASPGFRQQRIAASQGLSVEEAQRELKRLD